MGLTFLVLFAVELTIAAIRNRSALFCCLRSRCRSTALRAYSHKLSGLKTVTVSRGVAEMVTPRSATAMQPRLDEGQKIMVAARGITPVLSFALEEAQLRKAVLCVLLCKGNCRLFFRGPDGARSGPLAG